MYIQRWVTVGTRGTPWAQSISRRTVQNVTWPKSGSVYSDYARCWTVRGSILGRVKGLSSKTYKPVVWPTQPTVQLRVKWPGQADCSPTSVVEVKNECIFICTALYAFILAQGLYLFLPREPVLWVTGSRLPRRIRLDHFHLTCPYFSRLFCWGSV